MKKLFIVFALFISFFDAEASIIRMRACFSEDYYSSKVFLYGSFYRFQGFTLDPIFKDKTFSETLDLVLKRIHQVDPVKAKDYSLRLQYLLETVEMRANYKIRLQEQTHRCSDLEGVYVIEDLRKVKVWISKDVFKQLTPYEQVTIYIDILQTIERKRANVVDNGFDLDRAEFYFTTGASTPDLKRWLNNYKSAFNNNDSYFQLGHEYLDLWSIPYQY